jgi:predicted ATPase
MRNYRVLRPAVLNDIPVMSVPMGANGRAKAVFFDVFGFLEDALIDNVYTPWPNAGGGQIFALTSSGRPNTQH